MLLRNAQRSASKRTPPIAKTPKGIPPPAVKKCAVVVHDAFSAIVNNIKSLQSDVTDLKNQIATFGYLVNVVKQLEPLSVLTHEAESPTIDNLRGAAIFIDAVTVEILSRVRCANNAVVFNVSDRIPLTSVRNILLKASSLDNVNCTCLRLRKNIQRRNCPILFQFQDATTANRFIKSAGLIANNTTFKTIKVLADMTPLQREVRKRPSPQLPSPRKKTPMGITPGPQTDGPAILPHISNPQPYVPKTSGSANMPLPSTSHQLPPTETANEGAYLCPKTSQSDHRLMKPRNRTNSSQKRHHSAHQIKPRASPHSKSKHSNQQHAAETAESIATPVFVVPPKSVDLDSPSTPLPNHAGPVYKPPTWPQETPPTPNRRAAIVPNPPTKTADMLAPRQAWKSPKTRTNKSPRPDRKLPQKGAMHQNCNHWTSASTITGTNHHAKPQTFGRHVNYNVANPPVQPIPLPIPSHVAPPLMRAHPPFRLTYPTLNPAASNHFLQPETTNHFFWNLAAPPPPLVHLRTPQPLQFTPMALLQAHIENLLRYHSFTPIPLPYPTPQYRHPASNL